MNQIFVKGPRMDANAIAPDACQALVAFGVAAEAGLDPVTAQLVKVRASQINGCSYCLQLHSMIAAAMGETPQRLAAVGCWEDAALFTDRERAALALTEAVTSITDGGVADEVYAEAERHFPAGELAHLLLAIIAINAWTRLGVATRMSPDA